VTLEIRKTLVLSTSHVSAATAKMFDDNDPIDWPAIGGHYDGSGWFIYALPTIRSEHAPAELLKVMEFARENGCDNILFDADADQVDDLPTFEW
jgi:hypothetical protein